MNNKNCEDCLADLTDACTRGAGRAVDDEICDAFIPMDVYEVNKNESWELGYKQGRNDAIDEYRNILRERCVNHLNRYGKSKGIGHPAIFNLIDKAYKELKGEEECLHLK